MNHPIPNLPSLCCPGAGVYSGGRFGGKHRYNYCDKCHKRQDLYQKRNFAKPGIRVSVSDHAHCRCMDPNCRNRHYADCDICKPNGNELRASQPQKYRKKPVVIEAMQYVLGKPLPPGACDSAHDGFAGGVHVHTLEGTSYDLKYGDWIIKGVLGEYYPCDNIVFNRTYELVL